MNNSIRYSYLLILCCLTTPALANTSIADCQTKASSVDIYDCQVALLKQKKIALQSAYAHALDWVSSAGTKPSKQFRHAQRRWELLKDNDCAVVSAMYDGGTGGINAAYDCHIGHTEQRIQFLRQHFQ